MDATLTLGVLSAFLIVFIFVTGLSIRQDEHTGINRDINSIKDKTISNILVPAVLNVFEYEPPAYGERESELEDRLALQIEPGLLTIAKAYKCQELAKRLGRSMLWCGAAGILLEVVFISLVACLGASVPLFTASLSTSFLILVLCGVFWAIRRINIHQAEDMEEVI